MYGIFDQNANELYIGTASECDQWSRVHRQQYLNSAICEITSLSKGKYETAETMHLIERDNAFEYAGFGYNYKCSNLPEKYKGFLIFKRWDQFDWVWDIVSFGECLTMRAGPNGARKWVDEQGLKL